MPTKRVGATSEPARGRSTTRRASERNGVRVWGEVSITIAITDDPPQFVKVTFGHERISPSDTLADLQRTERTINEFNERTVNRRAEHYKRLAKAAGHAER
jgi:hypothetical protein